MLPIAIALAIVVLVLMRQSVVAVPSGFAYAIERLGRFERVLMPGLHVVLPFVSRVAGRIPLGEQTVDVPAVPCTTRDGESATCGGSVTFQVVDPAAAVSAVADLRAGVTTLASRVWMEAMAANPASLAPQAAHEAEDAIRAEASGWGLQIVHAQPLLKLSDRAIRDLEAKAAEERDARIAAWVRERGELPGPDGRPTAAQRSAYEEWMALEVRAHQKEIQAARREAERPAPAATGFETPAAAAIQFAVARGTIAPGALGRVEAGGREWTARSVSSVEIASGFRCAVERQDGDTLLVRAI
jgi:regulator of protease activity HflC (stomatin/prohibitin superfamily)